MLVQWWARVRVKQTVMMVAILATALTSGCVGDPIVSVPTNGMVMTFNDGSVDFGALNTFAMPDSIVHIAPATGTPLDISRQYDSVVLERVRRNFVSRGYTEVSAPSNKTPSFVVLVGATAMTDFRPWAPYPWYASWSFYDGWGWYSPGFNADWMLIFPWSVVFGGMVVDRGTILITVVPTASVNQIGKSMRSAWAGLATAELDDVSLTADGLRSCIDEMFRQSPFLAANGSLDRKAGTRVARLGAPE